MRATRTLSAILVASLVAAGCTRQPPTLAEPGLNRNTQALPPADLPFPTTPQSSADSDTTTAERGIGTFGSGG